MVDTFSGDPVMYGKVDRILTREYHGQMFTEEKLLILPYILDTLRDLAGCHRWARTDSEMDIA